MESVSGGAGVGEGGREEDAVAGNCVAVDEVIFRGAVGGGGGQGRGCGG